jgi:hypothetical protein
MAKSTDPRPVDHHLVGAALDNELAVHVARLFDNLCAGMREEADDPAPRRVPGTSALDRFAKSYHVAVAAHRAVNDKLEAEAERAEREEDATEANARIESDKRKAEEPAAA